MNDNHNELPENFESEDTFVEGMESDKTVLDSKISTAYDSKLKAQEENSDTRLEKKTENLKINDVIDDKYKIVRFLGKGGMGSVYQVEHLLLPNKKHFALKVLNPQFMQNEFFQKRFVREVEMAMEFAHENAVQIRDFGQESKSFMYFTMDFSSGQSLRDIVRREKISEKRALHIIKQILEVLQSAHKKGIIHRDLKPENILIENRDDEDHVLVLDFGIAKIMDDDQGEDLTQNQIIGTPLYMSPEQAAGEELDCQSDLYSVGIILYEMLTGVPPFKGNTRKILSDHITKAPKAPRKIQANISKEVEKVIITSLEKDKTLRYESATEFKNGVEQALLQQGVHKKACNFPIKKIGVGVGIFIFISVLLGVLFAFSQRVAIKVLKPEFLGQKNLDVEGTFAQITFSGTYSGNPTGIEMNGKVANIDRDKKSFTATYPLQYGKNTIQIKGIKGTKQVFLKTFTVHRKLPPDPEAGAEFRGNPCKTSVYISQRGNKKADKLWALRIQGDVYSGPSAGNNLLYIGTFYFRMRKNYGKLYAIEPLTGNIKWQFIAKGCITHPVALKDNVYFTSADSYIYSVDALTGKEKWKYKTGSAIWSSPTISKGVLYTTSTDGHLYAIDIFSGKELWKFQTNDRVVSSPAVSNDIIYFGSQNSIFYAISSKGKVIWQFTSQYQIRSTPTIANGKVFFVDYKTIYGLDLKTGEKKWQYKALGKIETPNLTIYKGNIYFGTSAFRRRFFSCVRISDSKTLWEMDFRWRISSSASVANNIIYLGKNRTLYALDAMTGKKLWNFHAMGNVKTAPVIFKNMIIFGTTSAMIISIR